MADTDTRTAAITALMDGVTDGPWKCEPMGGSSTVLAPSLPPRNDTRAEHPYGYGGDMFCLGYPFIDDMLKSTRMDFVSFGHADACFIAAARELVPALAAEHDAAIARAEQAEAERDDYKQRFESVCDEADQWREDSELQTRVCEAAKAERDAAITRAEQAEARERALLEGNEINRKALLQHNADHAAQVAALTARVAELEVALRHMTDAFDEHVSIPDPCCSCHLAPPCGDCVTWAFARENRESARAALAGEGGE